jgi:hypothetical protein
MAICMWTNTFGFTSDLEVKMVEYVPDEPPQPAAVTQPKKQAAKNANP